MSDADDIEAIREQKREELQSRAQTPDSPVHVESEDHLEDLVGTHPVALADFYADWCGPCKMLEPIVEKVAADTDAAVLKIDVDQHQGLAGSYNVSGVPTLHLFVDGEPTKQMVGVQDEGTLTDLIEQYA